MLTGTLSTQNAVSRHIPQGTYTLVGKEKNAHDHGANQSRIIKGLRKAKNILEELLTQDQTVC